MTLRYLTKIADMGYKKLPGSLKITRHLVNNHHKQDLPLTDLYKTPSLT